MAGSAQKPAKPATGKLFQWVAGKKEGWLEKNDYYPLQAQGVTA